MGTRGRPFVLTKEGFEEADAGTAERPQEETRTDQQNDGQVAIASRLHSETAADTAHAEKTRAAAATNVAPTRSQPTPLSRLIFSA